MTNARIAATFDEVAALLEQQGASAHRVRAWRDGALGVRDHHREMADVFRDHGRVGLEAVPGIGPHLANTIIQMIRSGRCGALDRLRGEHVPIHEPLQAPRALPPVALLLDVDREYRRAAEAGELVKIAPHRLNPKHEAWLPVLHVEHDGWMFTALYSNTQTAHELGRTHDWVILYFHHPHQPELQATVVTEWRGPLRGQRVVRGRERECADHYRSHRDQHDHRAA